MSFRRSAALVAAAVALLSGCKKVDQEQSPTDVIVASFASPYIPNPNDLSLAAIPTLPASAQRSLLQAFVNARGFPSDQAVSLTIPFIRYTYDAAQAKYVPHPVQIDPATVTSSTFALLRVDSGTAVVQSDWELDPANSVTAPDSTAWTLAIRRQPVGPAGAQHRRWTPGRYVFAIRGGASGVKTTDGKSVGPDFAVQSALQNLDMSNPQHAPIGTPEAKLALLENVRKALWLPLDWDNTGGYWVPAGAALPTPYAAVNGVFPAAELASFSTFEITPGAVSIAGVPMPTAPIDSGSGIAPLPLDLLRKNNGTNVDLNPAFGPAAQGLTTLDGFSTTAMVFAQVTVPVDAGTVTGSTVHLYKLKNGAVTRLKEFKQELATRLGSAGAAGDPAGAGWVAEPDPITTTLGKFVAPGVACAAAACSGIIGLQPAATVPVPQAYVGLFGIPSYVYLPPLDEATDYAVVITTSVKDMLGRPLQKATAAKILTDPGFDPVATSSVNGTSLLSGIDDKTATALEKMREQLAPVVVKFAADNPGKTAADIALAYTFRTQSGIAATGALNALALVGLPYSSAMAAAGVGAIAPDPDALATRTPAELLGATQYEADPSIADTLLASFAPVAEFAEVKFRSVSWLLGGANSGAFNPYAPVIETVTALVAIPKAASVTGTCPAATSAYTAASCAPLVVFEHGLGSAKANLLPIAGALAARGFVVAAIDLPMHGDRSYCSGSGVNAQAAANGQCGAGSHCQFIAGLTSPVDVDGGGAISIGTCKTSTGGNGAYLNYRIGCEGINPNGTPNLACLSGGGAGKGFAYASANRLLSLNFFRVRDALRQDVIDVSALIKALAPIGKSADAFATYLEASQGIAVDHNKVYWLGHSLGPAAASGNLAANPRISRAAIMAGGATSIDVFNNPASRYHGNLIAILGGAGIAEGTSDYFKLLQIGKWIIDPAEPANYARYFAGASGTALPSPFAGSPLAALWGAQPARDVLSQVMLCDGTVPNTQNRLLAGLVGRKDDGTFLPGYAVPEPTSTTNGRVQWFEASGAATCPADAVAHSNTFTLANPSLGVKAQTFLGGFLADPADTANTATPVTP